MLVSGSVNIVDSLMLQKSDEVFGMYEKRLASIVGYTTTLNSFSHNHGSGKVP